MEEQFQLSVRALRCRRGFPAAVGEVQKTLGCGVPFRCFL